jgi:acetolactate synthase I/II/III large subunit
LVLQCLYMPSGSSLFLDALAEAGVRYLFANLGSDHAGLLEAIAEAQASGRQVPRLITCPTEMVALSAAHAFAQVSGKAQAVIVHVECGTQSLAGAVHNAAKGRIPVLIFAGTSPFSQHGEAKGSRNEFIQWIQDVFDQRGIVRGYVKYDNEFRSPDTVREISHRALRFAYSDPKGPVYLMGSREVMEATAQTDSPRRATYWRGICAPGLPPEAVEAIATDLLRARRPLVVTSYLGRRAAAVRELVRLCGTLGVGVIESVPSYMNFPQDHELYLGNRWNTQEQDEALAEADVVLVIDSDVPWIPRFNRPTDDAIVHHIDIDPLKCQMPLAAISSNCAYQADAETAIRQINAFLAGLDVSSDVVAERTVRYAALHRRRNALIEAKERADEGLITPEYLTARIRRFLGADTLVMNEGISNYQPIWDHLRMTEPGGLYASGGGSLGWNGGAAIGAKLACPEKTVVALTGDGTYMMSLPTTVHWMARRYATPFLQVIYNNGGWKSPKLSMLAVHPDGFASRADDIGVAFPAPPDYVGIAVASGGAFGRVVQRVEELDAALEEAFHAIRVDGRAAVLDVHLPRL